MAPKTSRLAARAAAALLAAGSLASLAAVPSFAVSDCPPSAAPAPAGTAASATPDAPAPAPTTDAPDSYTKGTQVTLRNQTGGTIWVRGHRAFTDWWAPYVLNPGETVAYRGDFPGVDDVQLRIFRSAEDAKGNSVFKSIEVDAENPAWSSPWLSVSYQSKYYNVGTQHHYESPLAGAHFTGKRHGDSTHYKEFELTMTKGWNS